MTCALCARVSAQSARTENGFVISFDKTVGENGIWVCSHGRMASPNLNVERLWSMPDGTICLIIERETAPRYEICVVRGDEVLRQNRLYARGSAQMLAETWRSNLSPAAPSSIAC